MDLLLTHSRHRERETYENIYLDFSKQPGRCRFADTGVGWKPSAGGDTFTIDKDQITQGFWNKAAHGYEVKIYSRDDRILQLDGFLADDFDKVQKIFKNWYSVPFDTKEHSLRGWNWGKAEFGKAELAFNVQSRSAFEIPYSEILTTNLPGKNEVAIEFSLPGEGDETGTNGALGGARTSGKKAGGARDQLMEMRFYIPGVTAIATKKDKKDNEPNEDEEEEEVEEQNTAQVFYDTLLDKANIGDVAGVTIATFLDVLHLTPRFVSLLRTDKN
jgi:structure-specific recognition protein 1